MNTNEQKINKLKALLTVANEDFATKEEIGKLFVEIAKVVKDLKQKGEERYSTLEQTLTDLIRNHKTLSKSADYSVDYFKKELQTLKNIISNLKLQHGKDGKDADPIDTASIALEASKMAQDALKPLIPSISSITENVPVLGEKVRDSLELLQGEERLSASAIKDLPKAIETGAKFYGGSGIKEVIAGTNVTVDNTNLGYPIVSSTGGSYTLPTASDTVKGGVKIGARLTMTGEVLSADVQGGGGDFLADGSVPMTGTFQAVAGTTTVAPIKMLAGTSLTTPIAGVIEFDGSDYYVTI